AGPAHTDLPVVLSGDFNSPADGSGPASYGNVVHAGFQDAWLQTHPGKPGFTWGEAEDLRNPTPQLSQRIDYVLTHGNVSGLGMKVIGARPIDRTPSGLWPSDHAGLVATLEIAPSHPGHEHGGTGAGAAGGTSSRPGLRTTARSAGGIATEIVVALVDRTDKG